MSFKHICVISEGYPYKDDSWFSFVEQLVVAFAKNGVQCTVISPQSVSKTIMRGKTARPRKWIQHTAAGDVTVYQPLYLTFGSNCPPFLYKLAYDGYIDSIVNTVKKNNINVDAFYGHFWRSGLVAGRLSGLYNKPAFVACGESTITIFNKIDKEKYKKDLDNICGIISVSSENLKECERLGLSSGKKQVVIPNGIDGELFRKIDKDKARQAIGANQSDFIVAFLGAFIERKGPNRVAEAISMNKGIKSIFIGKGNLQPECEGIIYKGPLKHEVIPTYLNAADIFILPTLAEGCCNAIIEALACGLPVISSALPFNDDILSDDYSIRIDPNSVDEISEAITKLRSNSLLRESMSSKALLFASQLDINKRVDRILHFMTSTVVCK